MDDYTYDGHDLNSPELFSANCSVSQTQTGTLSFADGIQIFLIILFPGFFSL